MTQIQIVVTQTQQPDGTVKTEVSGHHSGAISAYVLGAGLMVLNDNLVQEEQLHIQEAFYLWVVEAREVQARLKRRIELEQCVDRARPHVRALNLDVCGRDAGRSGRLRLDPLHQDVQENRAEHEALT